MPEEAAKTFAAMAAELAEAQKAEAGRAEQARALEETRAESAKQKAELAARETEVAELKRHVETLEAAAAAERGDNTINVELDRNALIGRISCRSRMSRGRPSLAVSVAETSKEELREELDGMFEDMEFQDEQIALLREENDQLQRKVKELESRGVERRVGSGFLTARASSMRGTFGGDDSVVGVPLRTARQSGGVSFNLDFGSLPLRLEGSVDTSSMMTARTARLRRSGEADPTTSEPTVAELEAEIDELLEDLDARVVELEVQREEILDLEAQLRSFTNKERRDVGVATSDDVPVDTQMQATFRSFSQGNEVFATLQRMWQNIEAIDERHKAESQPVSLDASAASLHSDGPLESSFRRIDAGTLQTDEDLGKERLDYVLSLVTRMAETIQEFRIRLVESYDDLKEQREVSARMESMLASRGVSVDSFRPSVSVPRDEPHQRDDNMSEAGGQ